MFFLYLPELTGRGCYRAWAVLYAEIHFLIAASATRPACGAHADSYPQATPRFNHDGDESKALDQHMTREFIRAGAGSILRAQLRALATVVRVGTRTAQRQIEGFCDLVIRWFAREGLAFTLIFAGRSGLAWKSTENINPQPAQRTCQHRERQENVPPRDAKDKQD